MPALDGSGRSLTTVGDLLARTCAGGAARLELVAARPGAGSVRFTGTLDFERGVTALERVDDTARPLWIEVAGDEVAITAGGEPEERLTPPGSAGRDLGRSGVGLLGLLEPLAGERLAEGAAAELAPQRPAPWVRDVVLQVTGIALPGGRRAPELRVSCDGHGRLERLDVAGRRLLGTPRVTHTLRLSGWRA
jgi:hypothetical protein